MSNSKRQQVNQRLYFARINLQCMRTMLGEQQIPRHIVEQALGESALLHLVLTYRSYLAELAEAYALPFTQLESAQQLAGLLDTEGKTSAECTELQALENTPGWLPDLLQAYSRLLALSDAATESSTAKAQPLANGIRMQEVTGAELGYESLSEAYDGLQGLIDGQRTRLEEW